MLLLLLTIAVVDFVIGLRCWQSWTLLTICECCFVMFSFFLHAFKGFLPFQEQLQMKMGKHNQVIFLRAEFALPVKDSAIIVAKLYLYGGRVSAIKGCCAKVVVRFVTSLSRLVKI